MFGSLSLIAPIFCGIAAGPDVEVHVALVRKYVNAGFDHIVLTCPGNAQAEFIDFFARELKPRLDAL